MIKRHLLAATLGVALLSGCAAGSSKIVSSIASYSKTAAKEAAVETSMQVAAQVVQSNGGSATGTAAVAEYQQLVHEQLSSATTRTLCGWLAGSLTPEQFRGSLVNDLGAVAAQLGVPPDAAWMSRYIADAEGLTWQIAGAADPQAAANDAWGQLGCA